MRFFVIVFQSCHKQTCRFVGLLEKATGSFLRTKIGDGYEILSAVFSLLFLLMLALFLLFGFFKGIIGGPMWFRVLCYIKTIPYVFDVIFAAPHLLECVRREEFPKLPERPLWLRFLITLSFIEILPFGIALLIVRKSI